jgi:hypothetical protein
MQSKIEKLYELDEQRISVASELAIATLKMSGVINRIMSSPRGLKIAQASANYADFTLAFDDGKTFHNKEWITAQELGLMLAAEVAAEKAVADHYQTLSDIEKEVWNSAIKHWRGVPK